MEKFSIRLKELRKKKGLSQEALGRALSIGQTSIANYEANKRVPSLEIFIEIADIFNVSLDYLAGTKEKVKESLTDLSINMSPEGENYLDLLLVNNKKEAYQYIIDLKNSSWSNKEIYEKIFVPVLRRTGTLWENNKMSVGEEHFISNVIIETVAYLQTTLELDKKNKSKVLMATVADEEHMIGLKIMENILVEKGYNTYFLGSNTSIKHLIETIKLKKPETIILSITMKKFIDSLMTTIQMIRGNISTPSLQIVVTGQGIENKSHLVYTFGADAYGKNFEDVLDIIENKTFSKETR